ncbi:hypothetical protein EW146_g210 [Bondarzewia mesenterica]|uniref:Fungal-type protein kinase domain-containing protein n=1 Tax=Bondarzewia mesenterica TaxID=1095465 RepID=A0A4V3XGG4_9AGAM|nr:hypothetical protein EW146_g210 [Bondarzewia mesenterica]
MSASPIRLKTFASDSSESQFTLGTAQDYESIGTHATFIEQCVIGLFANVNRLVDWLVPDSALPFQLKDALKSFSDKSNRHVQYNDFAWGPGPDYDGLRDIKTSGAARFLNGIVSHLNSFSRVQTSRTWVAGHLNGIVVDPSSRRAKPSDQRHPDVVLLDYPRRNREAEWAEVLVVGEVNHSGEDAHIHLFEDVHQILMHQVDRRFVLGFTLVGKHFTFYLFDRAGGISTSQIDIHEAPETFLRTIGGMAYGDGGVLGYDPTISLAHGVVTVNDKRYKMVEPLFRADKIRGRGTTVFRVRRWQRQYVLKDAWVVDRGQPTEAEILRCAGNLSGIARLEDDEEVRFDGAVDSTGRRRSSVGLYAHQNLENRVHRRLVLKDCGMPLHTFATLRELLGAFIDGIGAHSVLYYEKQILHCDISASNIMLLDNGSPPGKRRGLLVDFDHAIKVGFPSTRIRGTLPYVAIDLLLCRSGLTHQASHDLESFFYVLCCICASSNGPHTPVIQKDTFLRYWKQDANPVVVGLAKLDHVRTDTAFNEQVLSGFQPYCHPLKQCARDLRRLFFGWTCQSISSLYAAEVKHASVIDVLRKAMRDLPPE